MKPGVPQITPSEALAEVIAWEIPIVGLGVALLRYSICLVVPVLVGLGGSDAAAELYEAVDDVGKWWP